MLKLLPNVSIALEQICIFKIRVLLQVAAGCLHFCVSRCGSYRCPLLKLQTLFLGSGKHHSPFPFSSGRWWQLPAVTNPVRFHHCLLVSLNLAHTFVNSRSTAYPSLTSVVWITMCPSSPGQCSNIISDVKRWRGMRAWWRTFDFIFCHFKKESGSNHSFSFILTMTSLYSYSKSDCPFHDLQDPAWPGFLSHR